MKVRMVCLTIAGACATLCFAIPAPQNKIDDIVFAKQAETGFPPGERCSDAVFIRRAYLDVTGMLPTAPEVRKFLADTSPAKRAALIDKLLNSPEYADYWALKWGDLLRIKAEFPSNLWPNAVHTYHRWLRNALRKNMPYDQFARALLTASGSNFRDAPVNFYRPFQQRTPRNLLDTAALVFMGVRLETSGWTEAQLIGMDAFFSKVGYKDTHEWKEEIIFFDASKKFPETPDGKTIYPTPVNGTSIKLADDADPRIAFADWLTAPDNPWFAQNIVNRIWFWMMGRGIIHEVDDIRPDNPAWSPELMNWLQTELTGSGYDLKHIFQLILNSGTYQLTSIPAPDNENDEAGFSHYRVRRLPAEILIDAICQVTGTSEEYSSAVPEPFTFVPEFRRTVMLADGSIKSAFLEMFGRPGRDSSLESDRNDNVSVFQMLHLLNSSHIRNKVMQSARLRGLFGRPPQGLSGVDMLYLEILSRYPAAEEKKIAENYRKESGLSYDQAHFDLAWALINSSEFLLKH
ncbi:MAG: DUF1553 domain-containing protein [Kiritimatiellales bacterium]